MRKNHERREPRPLKLILARAKIEEMSAEEVKERIGEARHQAICRRDPRPMFVELIAGHEGWSTGSMSAGSGRGKPARKLWTRERIRELVERMKGGAPVYLFHSSQGSRPRAGELLAAAARRLSGRLSAWGVAYISDPEAKSKIRSGELDACSIEAEIECHRSPNQPSGSWVVNAVRKVTGVALGNSRLARPGFDRAALVSVIEEFDQDPPEEQKRPEPEPEPSRKPSELFSRERLLDDPVVAGMIQDCRERDAERIRTLKGRLEIKEKKLRELKAGLSAAEEQREREPSPDRIPAPPEREDWADDLARNPLIPRTRRP